MKVSWRLTLLLVIVVISMLGKSPVVAAGIADVRDEAERGGYRLITTDELWDIVKGDPAGVLLVDTRQDWEYAAGHIKGAVNFPMEPTWLARLTKRGELEQLLGQERQKHIVFY